MSGLPVRFVDRGYHVAIESLGATIEGLTIVPSIAAAYAFALENDLNVRYVQTSGPATPLVVLR